MINSHLTEFVPFFKQRMEKASKNRVARFKKFEVEYSEDKLNVKGYK